MLTQSCVTDCVMTHRQNVFKLYILLYFDSGLFTLKRENCRTDEVALIVTTKLIIKYAYLDVFNLAGNKYIYVKILAYNVNKSLSKGYRSKQRLNIYKNIRNVEIIN